MKNKFVKEWIEKAEGDYETIVDLRRRKRKRQLFVIAFHCQQCVEKYLKALLTLYEIEFPKQHDLEALLALLVTKDALLAALRNELKVLTPYAVNFRYPGGDISGKEVSKAVVATKRLRKIFRQRLGLKG
jgi:HEPN domain-containing protein